MGVIPLSDASRRPTRFPVMTASIIAVNVVVFLASLWARDVRDYVSLHRPTSWRLCEVILLIGLIIR